MREVKLHIFSFDLFSRKLRWFHVEEKRVHNTQPNYSFLFARKVANILLTFLEDNMMLQSSISCLEKSYTFREDMSARFSNAIQGRSQDFSVGTHSFPSHLFTPPPPQKKKKIKVIFDSRVFYFKSRAQES